MLVVIAHVDVGGFGGRLAVFRRALGKPEIFVIRPSTRSLGFMSRKSSRVGATSTFRISTVGRRGTKSSAAATASARGNIATARRCETRNVSA